MTLRARRVPAARHMVVAVGRLLGALPARLRRAEHRVHGLALNRGRQLVLDDEVHQRAGCAAAPRRSIS